MTQIIRQLISHLEQLPQSLQDSYVARWMKELAEEQGDGAIQAASLNEADETTYEDIKHLSGVFKGPDDLSTNPKYLGDLGEKSMGRRK